MAASAFGRHGKSTEHLMTLWRRFQPSSVPCSSLPRPGDLALGGAAATPIRGMAFAADKKPKPSSGSTARKAAVNTEADPRLPLVLSMLQPESVASKPKPETQAELAAAQLRTEQFLRKKILRNDALLHDLHVKWQLQKEAIRALPAELREAALQPDLRPFPPARNYFFDTPPEAYRD